jgi:5'-nucleotidase
VQTTLTQQDEHHVRLAVEDLPREPVPGSDAALLADGWITVTGLDTVSHVPLGIVAEVGAG